MDTDLQGRIVMVTGGTGGLGQAVVRSLLACGARVHVTGKSAWTDPRVEQHEVDLRDEAAVVELYRRLDRLWASLHLVGGFAASSVEKTSGEDMRSMFELNAMTCFLCCREAVQAMRRGEGGGRIVNVGARPAVMPVAGMIAYSTSKAAVASITRSLAEEVRGDGILVNAVLPSIMDTPANRAAMPDADHARWPTVEQVAEAIVFLASPANALTSGALVPVYGRA